MDDIILPSFMPDDPQNKALSPSQKLNEARLFMMIKNMPEQTKRELLSLTWEEAVALAADAEEFRKSVHVYDPAFAKFTADEHNFLKLAELLEQRNRYLVFLKSTHS